MMKDLLDHAVSLKINALLAAGLTIGSSALTLGGKIAIDQARQEQVQIELKQARNDIRDVKLNLYNLERSVMRTEEQGRVQIDLLSKIINRK